MMKRKKCLITPEDFGVGDKNRVRTNGENSIYFRNISPLVSLDIKIYRYIPIKYLYDLIDAKHLYIPNRGLFSDITERTGKDKFIPTSKLPFEIKPVPAWKERRRYKEQERTTASTLDLCVSCWSAEDLNGQPHERFLMWKAYGYPHLSCRIGTTIRQLINEIEIPYNMIISDVSYQDRKCNYIDKGIFNKNKGYQDEREVRLVVLQNHLPHISIPIYNVNKIINEIILSPFVDPITESMLLHDLRNRYSKLGDIISPSSIMEY